MRIGTRLAVALLVPICACSSGGGGSAPAPDLATAHPMLPGRYVGTVWDADGDPHSAWLRIDQPGADGSTLMTAGCAVPDAYGDLLSEFVDGVGGYVTVSGGIATFTGYDGQPVELKWQIGETGALQELPGTVSSASPNFVRSAFSKTLEMATLRLLIGIGDDVRYFEREIVR